MTDKKTTEKETETAATFTEELTAVLEEIKEEPVKKEKKEIVTIVNETDIQIGERESTELLKIIVMPLILNA